MTSVLNARPFVALLFGASCLLTGCAIAPPDTPSDLGSAGAPMTPQTTYPQLLDAIDRGVSESSSYSIVSGLSAGDNLKRSIEPGRSASSGSAALVTWRIEGAEAPQQVATVLRLEDGALATERMVSFDRDVVTRFTPPLMLFPAALEQGVPVATDVEMEIASIDSPDRVTRTGTGTFVIELMGTESLQTEAGERVKALRVRTTLDSVFGPARVVRYTDRWFRARPPYRVVGERFEETVRVFGLVTDRRERAEWLPEYRGSDPAMD